MGRFWDPAGTLKSTKNGRGSEKVRPETAPEAIFVDFSLRCRAESLSGSIFGGSDPSKLCSRHNGSTILTKSPFSKKHRKCSLRGPVLGPKNAKNRRQGDLKSPKMMKKMDFRRSVFSTFFCMRKKFKTTKKGDPCSFLGRGRRSCGGRREGKEGKPFRARQT